MYVCKICRHHAEMDDLVLVYKINGHNTGACVCLRCYTRETVTDKPMPVYLRRQLEAIMVEISSGGA